jgi:hypothetical protein
MGKSWIEEEPGALGAWNELQRLKRRALARPFRAVALALVMTAAVVGMRAKKVRTFTSRVVFRVTEGDLDASTAPRPAKALRQYVLDVAFSNHHLLDVIKAHGLYAREMKRDPSFAIEAMRDDIEVEVWRNYFMEQRQTDDAGRSARIGISYQSKNADEAYVVVQHLGRLVAEEEEAARVAMADEAVRQSALSVEQARAAVARVRGDLIVKELALRQAKPPVDALLRIELFNLKQSVEPLEARLRDLVAKNNALQLRAGLEKNKLGLRFELVDPGRVARGGISKPRELAFIGTIAFLILLPLAGMAAGAFDSRIYDAEDVRRLGLAAVGQVPSFPGDDAGTLDSRLKRDHGLE